MVGTAELKEGAGIDSRKIRPSALLSDPAAPPGGPVRLGEPEPVPAPPPQRSLSVLEDIIMASDRRAAPVTVGMVARTSGIIDVPTLRDAVRAVLARNPMARARMRTTASGRLWCFPEATDGEAAEDTVLTATSGADETDLWEAFAALCSQPFRLTAMPPLRVMHIRLPDGDAVALAAHHVALDGLSVAMLLREILARCAGTAGTAGTGEHGPGTPRTGPGTAAQPGPAPGPTYPAPAVVSTSGVTASTRPVRRPVPDLSVLSRTVPSRVAAAPGRRGRRHGPAERRQLAYGVHCEAVGIPKSGVPKLGVPTPGRPVTGRSTATVNDILLAAAQVAVERWNTAAGRRTRQLRVRMPVNLRQPGDGSAIGNHTGEVLITTGPSDRRDPATLLAAVCGQTAAGKTGGPPPGPAYADGGVARLPAPLRRGLLRLAATVARPVLMPTTSVTNLGRLPDPLADPGTAGTHDLCVTSLHFAAFAGMPQGLVIAALGYGDELHVTFCYHRDLFDRAAVNRFAQLFRAALDEIG